MADKAQQSIDIKSVKAHYLKLAQKYHPDVIQHSLKEGGEEVDENAAITAAEDMFIEVKAAFDKLV